MRKTETIELGDEPKTKVTIKELTVEEIIGIFTKWAESAEGKAEDDKSIKDELRSLYEMSVEGLAFDDLNSFAPSELKELWTTFQEVNSVFFEVIDSLGIRESLTELIKETRKDFLKIFRGSSSADILTS